MSHKRMRQTLPHPLPPFRNAVVSRNRFERCVRLDRGSASLRILMDIFGDFADTSSSKNHECGGQAIANIAAGLLVRD
jgi:hypothetical protein